MAIKLIASYSKKIGLPGFSSVGLHLAVETELHTLEEVTKQSEQLYNLLQRSVDERLEQSPGFVPPDGFGLDDGKNGEWKCSPKQRALIEKIMSENKVHQKEIEDLALARFGVGLTELNKLQTSGLIDELLERHGNGARAQSRGTRFRQNGGGVNGGTR